MLNPYTTRPSSAPAPKIEQGRGPNKSSTPTPLSGAPSGPTHNWQRPSWRPGQVQRPVLQKPALQHGFLEKGEFRKHDELIHELRKNTYYKNIPTYGKKLGLAERMKLISELEKIGKGMGGLTEQKLGFAIKKLGKERGRALTHWKFKEAKTLDQKIKQAQSWKKAWNRPKL